MIESIQDNLLQLSTLLSKLEKTAYCCPTPLLSKATIGQHMRHILEFYRCLLLGLPDGQVNYDARERDLVLESDPLAALEAIEDILRQLSLIKEDTPLKLYGTYSAKNQRQEKINTHLFRELAYCLEHSIHHQALIKVGLLEQNLNELIPEDFGVAPATIHARENSSLQV